MKNSVKENLLLEMNGILITNSCSKTKSRWVLKEKNRKEIREDLK
jgi:hypothetical protein